MQLITQQKTHPDEQLYQLQQTIVKILYQNKALLYKQQQTSSQKKQLMFSGYGFLQRLQKVLNLIWNCKLSKSKVTLQLKLNIESCFISKMLCQCLKGNDKQSVEFINITNNLNVESKQGIFWIQKEQGQIGFRVKVQRIQFINSKKNLEKILRKYIVSSLFLYLQTIENLIFYFRVFGYSLTDLEMNMPQNYMSPLMKETIELSQIKQLFQQMQSRDSAQNHNSSKIPLYMTFNFNYNMFPTKNCISQKFKAEILSQFQMLQGQLTHLNKTKHHFILTCIDIKGRNAQLVIQSGGFCDIVRGIYSYIPIVSICDFSSVKASPKYQVQPNKSIIVSNQLVKKISLAQQNINISHQTQCRFLIAMRNKKCPYIARYYVPKSVVPFSNGQIFMDYYSCNLADSNLKEDMKLKVIYDISMGLLFLQDNGVVHRDIKQANIVLDRNYRAKIIDFGSAASFKKDIFKQLDNKVRLTQGYFIPYSELVKKHKFILQKFTKETYYSHPNFDLFSLGKILQNQFFLQHVVAESHFLRYNLDYLSKKCQQIDPNRRWHPKQILVFLRHLIKFNCLRSSFWRSRGITLKTLAVNDFNLKIDWEQQQIESFDNIQTKKIFADKKANDEREPQIFRQ